ncbi:hypothetical protein Droror1_Dr00024482, partial [Drosera rotundifolia]
VLVRQVHVRCSRGERNKLREVRWPKLHHEHHKRRSGCVPTQRDEAILFHIQQRLLLWGNESCHQCYSPRVGTS